MFSVLFTAKKTIGKGQLQFIYAVQKQKNIKILKFRGAAALAPPLPIN